MACQGTLLIVCVVGLVSYLGGVQRGLLHLWRALLFHVEVGLFAPLVVLLSLVLQLLADNMS